jgi:hypothetical protein
MGTQTPDSSPTTWLHFQSSCVTNLKIDYNLIDWTKLAYGVRSNNMGTPVPIQKKSVFISYAHKDAMDFTRRLAFDLSFFADVFWDRRLQAGKYPPQLKQEIEASTSRRKKGWG